MWVWRDDDLDRLTIAIYFNVLCRSNGIRKLCYALFLRCKIEVKWMKTTLTEEKKYLTHICSIMIVVAIYPHAFDKTKQMARRNALSSIRNENIRQWEGKIWMFSFYVPSNWLPCFTSNIYMYATNSFLALRRVIEHALPDSLFNPPPFDYYYYYYSIGMLLGA